MKRLVFIDNDHEERTQEDSCYIKYPLEGSGLSSEYVDTLELISNFYHMEREDKLKILFDPETIICTWAMYTWNHFNSLGQLTTFLAGAGRNGIKDKIYCDASGEMMKALNREIMNLEGNTLIPLLRAIETNYILTIDQDEDVFKFQRLRVNLQGDNYDYFKLEEINLPELVA